jgi:uncharacterized protein YcsI (UPF0317 family)
MNRLSDAQQDNATLATANSRKKKDSPVQLFLRKTFTMLNTGPSDIAGWSDDGLSFFIKCQFQFADNVIPKFFKHNNFSSFVRQLNFYGFRKVKNSATVRFVSIYAF